MSFDFAQLHKNYDKVMQIVADDLKMIKTGRAKPSLIEDITAEVYGTMMPLKELGSISSPDAQTILIQPWDHSVVSGIEKALQKSGYNPNVDGNNVRINIPPLTGEKRQEMIKQVSQHIESGKQMLRNERTEIKRLVEGQKGSNGVSEDDIKAELEKLDKVTHEYTDKLDEMGDAKKKELETI